MTEEVDKQRRKALVAAASVVGGAGVVAAVVPFVESMEPSAKAQAAGAPVEVDISKLGPGELMTVEWRGKPIWILHRTPHMLEALKEVRDQLKDPDSKQSIQPDFAKNEYRSLKPEYLVVIGICTHLGCSPTFRPDEAPPDLGPQWKGGYFCPCHGSRFDLAGRVLKGSPAPTNLVVPPYRFLSDTRLLVGAETEAA